MKVLQLISSKGYFGAENVLVQLAAELKKSNSCQIVVGVIKNLATPHMEVITECETRGINSAYFPCSGKFDHKTILQLRRYVKDQKIDIIHSHGYKSNLYSFFSTIGLPVRLVATCHNWVGDYPKMKFYASLDRFFLKKYSHIVAVSMEVQNKITQSNISNDKVSMIRNGVDVQHFDNVDRTLKFRASLGIPGHHVVIGTVGRISSEKGHIHLLNAVKSIQEQFPEITLMIVGDGNLLEEFQRKFKDPLIIFTGQRNDLPDLYKCMDVFALPSLTEGLPMVLLEAMSSCLPVVATRVGYVPNVIIEKETGLLVEPGDEEGLRKSLLNLVEDQKARKLMGQRGYERVKENFSSAEMAREYIEVYRKIIGGTP